jgi:hypothetical protein
MLDKDHPLLDFAAAYMLEKFYPCYVFIMPHGGMCEARFFRENLAGTTWAWDQFTYIQVLPPKTINYQTNQVVSWVWQLGSIPDTVMLTGYLNRHIIAWDLMELSPLLLLGESVELSVDRYRKHEDVGIIAI